MKAYVTGAYSMGWRLAFLYFTLQFVQFAHASGFVNTIKQYPDEGIVIVCVLALLGGVFIATTYDLPNGATKDMTKARKVGYALIGGILSFIYMITTQKSLYLAQSIGVVAVSGTSPALLHILYTLVVKKVVSIVNVIFFDEKKGNED